MEGMRKFIQQRDAGCCRALMEGLRKWSLQVNEFRWACQVAMKQFPGQGLVAVVVFAFHLVVREASSVGLEGNEPLNTRCTKEGEEMSTRLRYLCRRKRTSKDWHAWNSPRSLARRRAVCIYTQSDSKESKHRRTGSVCVFFTTRCRRGKKSNKHMATRLDVTLWNVSSKQ